VKENYSGWKALLMPLLFTSMMWLVFLISAAGGMDLHAFGILPRTASGLIGILTSPFVHSNLNHIASNTLPLLVVGMGLFYFYKEIAWRVLGMIYLLTGFWVWLAARPSYHVGASGLIYGLVCFTFFSGLIRRDRSLLAISLLVTFLYGSMVWGILPVDQTVSWESHLFGSAAGIFAAIYFRKEGPVKEKYSWELEEEEEGRQEANPETGTTYTSDGIVIQYDFKENTPEEDPKNESSNN
jgi:membrane associated rhomboid family serine protease